MSVMSEGSRIGYDASGISVFPFPFFFFHESHLKVYLDDNRLELGTDYTVSGALNLAGGEVAFSVAPTEGAITIVRDTPLTQENSLNDGGDFSSITIERMFDKLTYICQQLSEQINRSLKLPIHSPIGAQFTGNIVPHALLKMNEDGTAFELGLSVDAYATQLQAFVDQANQILTDTNALRDAVELLKTDTQALLDQTNTAKQGAEQAAQDAVEALVDVNAEIDSIKNTLSDQFGFGDPNTDGSWRFQVDANMALLIQRREGGNWINKQKIGGPL